MRVAMMGRLSPAMQMTLVALLVVTVVWSWWWFLSVSSGNDDYYEGDGRGYIVDPPPSLSGVGDDQGKNGTEIARELARWYFARWHQQGHTVSAEMHERALNITVYVQEQGLRLQKINGRLYYYGRRGYMCRRQSTLWLFMRMLELYPDTPDFDIAVNIADTARVQLKEYHPGEALPLVISPSRTAEEADILMPDFTFHHWVDKRVPHFWREFVPSVDALHISFDIKRPTMLWRGLPHGVTRPSLREVVVQNLRDLVNVGLLKEHQVDVKFSDGTDGDFVSMYDHCRYRYLVSIEGMSWTARNKHLMVCGSVMLLQDTSFQDFHTPLLRPWTHYVPFRWDGKDLVKRLDYLESHPQRTRLIANACRNFADTLFSEEAVMAYLHEMVIQYRSLQRFPLQPDLKRTIDITGATADDVDKFPGFYLFDTDDVKPRRWPGLGWIDPDNKNPDHCVRVSNSPVT